MRKLIINANPVNPFEIFELNDGELTHISEQRWARQALDFIKSYAADAQEEVDTTFIGPANYVKHFVDEANKLEFVKAAALEDNYVKVSY